MKRRARRVLPAVLLAAALLCGCGGTAAPAGDVYPWAEEDAAIRRAAEDGSFGQGDKLAVYDGVSGRYSFHGAWLPEELRAGSPEEIGAFVCYDSRAVSLRSPLDWRDGYIHPYGEGFSASYEIQELNGRSPVVIDDPILDPTGRASTLADYLRLYVPLLLRSDRQTRLVRTLNDPNSAVVFADGVKFVGYDEAAGRYTLERIPEELRAERTDEIGYILSYRTGWEERTIDFGSKGPVDVRFEQFDARILTAADSGELDAFRLGAVYPTVMTFVNGKAKDLPVTEGEIKSELHSVFVFDHGMDWPYE